MNSFIINGTEYECEDLDMSEDIESLVTKNYIFFENKGEYGGILIVIDRNAKKILNKLNLFESSYVRWIENGFIHIETKDTGVIEIFNGLTGKFHYLNLNEFRFVHTEDTDNDDSESHDDIHDYDDDDIHEIFDDLLSETEPWDLEIYENKLTMVSEQGKFIFPLEDDKITEIVVKNIDPL